MTSVALSLCYFKAQNDMSNWDNSTGRPEPDQSLLGDICFTKCSDFGNCAQGESFLNFFSKPLQQNHVTVITFLS